MKAIQMTMDEKLLRELDATEEVKREGRSALMRRAVAEYLERRRRQDITQRYRKAYRGTKGLGDEFEGWKDQGEWPAE
jgi:metal-responsive CopG/Arc/MetJ family transcriptional regulator